MSSLWTPGGEHKVEPPGKTSGSPGAPGGSSGQDAPHRTGPGTTAGASQAEQPDEAELDEVRKQLLDAPVEVVVANHAYGLFELAALHLSAQPPRLDKARLAVDALGALIEGLAGRLGNVEPALMEALAQIRLAYVQISASPDTEPSDTANSDTANSDTANSDTANSDTEGQQSA